MKKWLGMISSAAAGVLGFVFLALASFYQKITMVGVSSSDTFNAYDLIKESADNIKGFGLYKAFTIILIVVAALLIAWALVLLLKNLKVLKIKFNVNIVNIALLTLFAVSAIVSIIALFVMGGDFAVNVGGSGVKAGPAIGAWLNLAVGVLALVCGIIPAVSKSKK